MNVKRIVSEYAVRLRAKPRVLDGAIYASEIQVRAASLSFI